MEERRLDVFLSCPTTASFEGTQFLEQLMRLLESQAMRARTVGVTEFHNAAPLAAVREVMAECHGAVVVGLAQMLVHRGIAKVDTDESDRVRDMYLPTPWNQIEAGMAVAYGLPLMLIRESRVASTGIFDSSVGDRFVHQAVVSAEWLTSQPFLQVLREFATEVTSHARPASSAL
jgi:hypothetical protein